MKIIIKLKLEVISLSETSSICVKGEMWVGLKCSHLGVMEECCSFGTKAKLRSCKLNQGPTHYLQIFGKIKIQKVEMISGVLWPK